MVLLYYYGTNARSSVNIIALRILLPLTFIAMVLHSAESVSLSSSSSSQSKQESSCETFDDVDFVSCTFHDLSNEALTNICKTLVGLDMELHMFPYLDEQDMINHEEVTTDSVNDKVRDHSNEKKRPHFEYVRAAEECLLIQMEVQEMLEGDPEALKQWERTVCEFISYILYSTCGYCALLYLQSRTYATERFVLHCFKQLLRSHILRHLCLVFAFNMIK